MAGRPKKPTSLHVIEGNRSKIDLDKRIAEEPKARKYSMDNLPGPPEWMDDRAKGEWKRIVPELVVMDLFTKADVSALEAYCVTYSRWQQIEIELSEMDKLFFVTPNGYQQQVPQINAANKYLAQCKKFMTEFGLTPSARGRMSLPSNEDDDPMAKLMMGLE
jgi:P27 family predicted phage terminase small subunit